MPQVAPNADEYADTRIGIFFPGVIPSLDGQCVSLVKWFLAEMTEVPNPQAPRGDARYMGKTLVSQGHATEVPYDQHKRGDVVCYEYGQYGHIGVVLSGNRTFEENVHWPGVASKIVDGDTVYASRIGNLGEVWRHDMHIYRIKTYNEGGNMPYVDQAVLDDLENWKLTGQALSYDPAYEAMGGKSGSPLGSDTSGIKRVMDDFRKNKEENLAKPKQFKKLDQDVYVEDK